MASSRWKRFAFFDRHTLNLPSQVLEDLIPQSDTTGSSSRRLSVRLDVPEMSMAVSTASLPAMSMADPASSSSQQQQPLSAMWSSLTACTATTSDDAPSSDSIRLPSQQQQSSSSSSSTAMSLSDGLVLVWVTSQSTPYLHCIDITLRCRSALDEHDLDGWRGYVLGNSAEKGIVDLATCSSSGSVLHVACLTASSEILIHVNPHLNLSCRLPMTKPSSIQSTIKMFSTWNDAQYGRATTLDMKPGLLAIGTNTGHVLVAEYNTTQITVTFAIPPPPTSMAVTSLRLMPSAVFCAYPKGISCFEFSATGVTARHDLDSRSVGWRGLTDIFAGDKLMVARTDGIYLYTKTQKQGVSPIDGTKNAICAIPPSQKKEVGSSYTLVASTDTKSGRDAVDIYDATNKLVAFHVLLSPGHKALRAVGIATKPTATTDGSVKGGLSTAVVFTSGGSVVTLTEKATTDKISLLVQKNLYAAAISMAYADPSFQPADITALYRKHAEHLYRKGDYTGAMDQYIYTIGSLESAHVIFRYLDAPKIPMLARYLEKLRERDMATPVHNELLRTCYLKLNDNEAAEKIAAPSRSTASASSCVSSSLAHNRPKEALATVCSLQAPQAAEALVVHGAALARALPRETAGVVVSLCVGSYSPQALAEAAEAAGDATSKLLEYSGLLQDSTAAPRGGPLQCTPYPVHLFASAFVESPKVLRLILAHCNRNKCPLTPSLRRTLLELTLDEWNDAKRSGDTEVESLRRKEAITALTDAHCGDIGDYDALVIVQLAGFSEGELLLYERLQMTPMLLARYAQDGGDRARRHMLAMCRTDPEVLADVLGHFVNIASERIKPRDNADDDASMNSDEEEILDDIREALALARAQGALPPVRIARILAGEGAGQFSVHDTQRGSDGTAQQTVPLSVALDYVGAILDDSRQEIGRLKAEVEEYNQLCNTMEAEVNSLLRGGSVQASSDDGTTKSNRMNIEELHSKLKSSLEDGTRSENRSAESREAFWREMNQSDDRFETIARFFAKGIIQ